jgi:tetratricopeptide (TPR) repeat protein
MGFCVWMLMSISMLGISSALAADAVASAKYEGAGSQLYQSGDFAKAIQYYQAAIQTDPSRTASYVGLGNSQYRLGHKEEALAAYEKALALDPTNAQLGQFARAPGGGLWDGGPPEARNGSFLTKTICRIDPDV